LIDRYTDGKINKKVKGRKDEREEEKNRKIQDETSQDEVGD